MIGSILVAGLAVVQSCVGMIEVHQSIDAGEVWLIATYARAVHVGPFPAINRVAEKRELQWYTVAYYPKAGREEWGRDTIEVVDLRGRVVRAVEQFAATPSLRLIPLAGSVETGDMQRKPMRRGEGVPLFVAFRERFALRDVAEVRLGRRIEATAAPVDTTWRGR